MKSLRRKQNFRGFEEADFILPKYDLGFTTYLIMDDRLNLKSA